MCGRYSLSTPGELVSEVFDVEESVQLEPRYNIAPTQLAPIVRAGSGGERRLELARWGLIPSWARDESMGNRTINARSESAPEIRSFREPFRRRRCLVPADGFYEWQQRTDGKQPYHLTLASREPFAFAGLYDLWRSGKEDWIQSFTILTTEPNELLEPLHDRMPVILPREAHDFWIDPTVDAVEPLQALLQPLPAAQMLATPVSRLVNKPENDSPECVREVEIAPEPRNLTLFD